MNGDDIKWLEKLFEQHKEDQRIYLDDKFETVSRKFDAVNKKLDIRVNDCKDCRACIDDNIASIGSKLETYNKDSTKKVVVGSAVAVVITLLLYAVFGTDAINYVLAMLGKLVELPI